MKATPQPLVSIVTPLHNEESYLAECIESVLAQRYSNWEYTIVDNCSTDASLEIARRYAARDGRIRVEHNSIPVSAIGNHNLALRQISPMSKYCKVVFGDDWIFPECLERMVAVAEQYPSVGIVSAYALEGQRVNWTGLPYPASLISGREICRKHFLDSLYVFGTPSSVLYRADLVRSRDPFYDETNIHADTEVCFALLRSCDFAFVHQVLSYTRVREGSLSTVAAGTNAHFGVMLHLLLTYGAYYLTEEELESCLDRHLVGYYRFLGENLVLGRGREFWDYHKRELAAAGLHLRRLRLARSIIGMLCGAALNPKDTVEKLFKRRRQNRSATDRESVGIANPVVSSGFGSH